MARLEFEEAHRRHNLAGRVFLPRSPITTRETFAGRWDYLTTIADAVQQPGVHIALYGDRGVGKTSLSNVVSPTVQVLDKHFGITNRLIVKTVATSNDNFASIWVKLFKDVLWNDGKPTVGFLSQQKNPKNLVEAFGLQQNLSVDDVRRALSMLKGALFIVDEFDRTGNTASQPFSDLIKTLSDLSIDVTVMLVGVAGTIETLIKDHASINRALIQIHLPRMREDELKAILDTAAKTLEVSFSEEASDLIIRLSQGLAHYTHLIGLHAVRHALMKDWEDVIGRDATFAGLKAAVSEAEHSTSAKYIKATHSGHQDALFRQVLLACAVSASKSSDPLGFFNPASVTDPLSLILERPVQIATFNNHLADFTNMDKRGAALEREGPPRAFRYRFSDPLLVPYIFMNASVTGLLTNTAILHLLRSS